MNEEMRIDFPGLMKERLPSGAFRFRVRVAGQKARKITLSVTPDHPRFREHYHAARSGIRLPVEAEAPRTITGSIGWLVDGYVRWMEATRDAGHLHKVTVHQRTVFLTRLRAEAGEYSVNMPAGELLKLRDMKAATPGAADNFIKAVRAMYSWGMEREGTLVKTNPAAGLKKINVDKGATPWTIADLKAFRERHAPGTMAHAALSLYMFTACRVGDVIHLGPGNEFQRDGTTWLGWQPAKKGSRRVEIPMVPPLLSAVRALTLQGQTYLQTEHAAPFASPKAFANRFGKWVAQAGLSDRSSHGIRKSAGELMALHGASQYHIMAVHGHASARTSETYTREVERGRLAEQAMQALAGLEW